VGVGNHEVVDPPDDPDIAWVRAHFATLPHIVRSGPTNGETTTYSFDYGNAHFVVLNEYYDGRSDTGAGGKVCDALYDWLVEDLDSNTKPCVLVFGHEPAFPFYRHTETSMNQHPENRDRFWHLLDSKGVVAYICGHTHHYSRGRGFGSKVWQVDLGNGGDSTDRNESTFADITVTDTHVRFAVWQGRQGVAYSLNDSWDVPFASARDFAPENNARDIPAAASLTWSGATGTVSHDVYLGTCRTAIECATTDSPSYRGNHETTQVTVACIDFDTTHYWRVDEVTADGTVVTGRVRRFAAGPRAPVIRNRRTREIPLNTVSEVIIPAGATWRYLDNGGNMGTRWRDKDFDDSRWSSGAARLGYGNGDEETIVSYGPDAGNRFATVYFRRTFVLSNVTTYTSLDLGILRDDGAVVYLNGTEVFRDNMPHGPVGHTTYAAVCVSNVVELVGGRLLTDVLKDGTNVLAVEMHLSGPDGQDLGFDLQLEATRTIPASPLGTADPLVAQGAEWRYLDDGSNQGTAWTASSFDDSDWSVGRAQFGYGEGDEGTVIGFGPDPDNKNITTYFRRALNVPDASRYTDIEACLVRDDGAVIYINGAEIWRSSMPEGLITYRTHADYDSGPEHVWHRERVSANPLVDGLNVVAAEVHQVNETSSDMSFDLQLLGHNSTSIHGSATNVSRSSAWLNGELLSAGAAAAQVYAFWGAGDAGTSATGWAHTNYLGSYLDCCPLALTTPITGLRSETVYYYRFYATSAFGHCWAPYSAAFRTSGTNEPVRYSFRALSPRHGSLAGQTSAWIAAGHTAHVEALPNKYYKFDRWIGSTNSADNPLAMEVHAPCTVTALYTDVTTPGGVPHIWLDGLHQLGTSDVVETVDHDGDGHNALQEWLADTIPTNPRSVLKLTGVTRADNGIRVEWKGGVQATQFLDRATRLDATTQWRTVFTNPPPTSVGVHRQPSGGKRGALFYRVRAGR